MFTTNPICSALVLLGKPIFIEVLNKGPQVNPLNCPTPYFCKTQFDSIFPSEIMLPYAIKIFRPNASNSKLYTNTLTTSRAIPTAMHKSHNNARVFLKTALGSTRKPFLYQLYALADRSKPGTEQRGHHTIGHWTRHIADMTGTRVVPTGQAG